MLAQNTTKLKQGQKAAGVVSLIVVALALAKAGAGFLTGSLILLSDAVHSASDVVSTFASFLGLKIAQREPDERFPYGYYKAESLAASFVSILIILAGGEFLTEGYQALFAPAQLRLASLALMVAAGSALVDFLTARYLKKVGEEVGSQALLNNAIDKRNDVFTSSVVFVGLILSFLNIAYVEGIITMAIALILIWTGLQALKESVFALLDVSPGKEIENKVAEAILAVPGIEEYRQLRLRRAGPFVFGEVKVCIRRFVDVGRSHEIADRVEKAVKNQVSQVGSLSVHVEPFKSEFQHLVFPVKEKKGLNSKISQSFGRAPFYLFVNLKKKEVKSFYFLSNPFSERKDKAGLSAAKLISSQKSETVITKEIGEISLYALRDFLIDVYSARKKTAGENLELFLNNELEVIQVPTKEVSS